MAGGGSLPPSGQEVVLSLKNTLVLKSSNATKAEGDAPIALDAENYISSLDVYVFASDKEDGKYTFQELFYYRDDATQTINKDWAHSFSLTPSDDGKSSIGLLRLTKGLFVKLYCIANQTTLYSTDATTGFATAYTTFQPLLQTAPGQADNVVTPGKPTLKEFEQLHTPLIDPKKVSDVLVSPLPMTGAYIVPLDLTDFTVSARLRAGIKLTRMVARFDVINDSDKSKFKITGISLANGRKGTTFFPVKPLGKVPDDLITYPYRKVTSAQKASNHTDQLKGAFYSYPSLKDDEGYLILKGIYYPNKTEEKEVLYRVPFKQVVNGNGGYLEISPNHRYTVAITQADEYHLDLEFTVADWSDDGSIDDYEPDNSLGEFTVTITDAFAANIVHNKATRTVTIRKEAAQNANFAVSVSTNSLLSAALTYQGNTKKYPWLAFTESEAEGNPGDKYVKVYTYTVSLAKDYAANGHPCATLHLTDKASGNEELLYIKYNAFALTVVIEEIPEMTEDSKKYNKVNVSTKTAVMYRMDNSRLAIGINCPDEIGLQGEAPEGLEVTHLSQIGDKHIFLLTLTKKDVAVKDNQLTVTFVDPKDVSHRSETITIQLINVDVHTPTFSTATSDGSKEITVENAATGKPATVVIPPIENNSFTVSTQATAGVNVVMNYGLNNPEWLNYAIEEPAPLVKAAVEPTPATKIKFSLNNNKLKGAKPVTVTIKNQISTAGSYSFIVKPKWIAPVTTENQISVTAFNATGGNTIKFRIYNSLLDLESLKTGEYTEFTVTVNKVDRVAAQNKVQLNQLYWTTGHLVADGNGGCGVGAPTDYGVYFRWGSLMGYSSEGGNADIGAANAKDPSVYPEEYGTPPAPCVPLSTSLRKRRRKCS